MLTLIDKLPTFIGCVKLIYFAIIFIKKTNLGVIYMKFNEKLIELRKAKGLSQEELGNELGVSRQTISKWELGQSYPDFQKLVLLSDFFNISLDKLIKDIDLDDVRKNNQSDEKVSKMYEDFQTAKFIFNQIFNIFSFIGLGSIVILILALCRKILT